jgi:hypothetical protein
MLETLGVLIGVLFLIGFLIFVIRMAIYIVSGQYELDQRFDRYCK